MRVSRVFGLLLVLGFFLGTNTPAVANPFEKELSHLLIHHPQIKSQEKSVASAHKGIDSAMAGFWPSVSLTTDLGVEHIDNPTTRSSIEGGKDWNRTRNVAGLTVTHNLFDGFATSSGVRSARLGVAVAQYTLEGTRQNLLFEGINNYLDVLRQKRLIDLSRSNEDTIARQLNLEDERVSRGSGVAVDVLQAKSRLQIAKERRVSFEGDLVKAVSRYIQAFDHGPDLEAMTDPAPPVDLIPNSVEEAVNIAIRENPAVTNAEATIAVARESRRAIQAEYMPSVDLIGSANYEKHKNATIGTRRDYSLLIEATWDLFTGFTTQANAEQAAFDYRAAKDNHEFVSRKIAEQVKLSWQDLLTARERLALLENAVAIATEVHDSRKKLREAGKETVINVLDAENEIFNSQINFTAGFRALIPRLDDGNPSNLGIRGADPVSPRKSSRIRPSLAKLPLIYPPADSMIPPASARRGETGFFLGGYQERPFQPQIQGLGGNAGVHSGR